MSFYNTKPAVRRTGNKVIPSRPTKRFDDWFEAWSFLQDLRDWSFDQLRDIGFTTDVFNDHVKQLREADARNAALLDYINSEDFGTDTAYYKIHNSAAISSRDAEMMD